MKLGTIDNVQIVGATKTKMLALDTILLHVSVKNIKWKGSVSLNCTPGWIVSQASKGEEHVSEQLIKVAQSIMWKHVDVPDVQKEIGLTVIE